MQERIAIVGGGVAGLTAGYLLNEKYDVTLFEKSGRLGGNAWTYMTRYGEEVDIAVAAFGKAGYKHLFELFSRLKVKTKSYRAYVSLHNLDTKTGLYLTPSIRGLWAQRFGVLRSKHVIEVLQLLKVVRKARRLLHEGEFEGITLREGLRKVPHMTGHTRLLFLFALSMISSMSCEAVLNGPAEYFVKLIDIHDDALSCRAFYSVAGVENLTRGYVEALASGYRDGIVFNSDIKTIVREHGRIVVLAESGVKRVFDEIVFACGADQALSLLDSPTPEEKRLLGAWRFNKRRMVIHQDYSSFPERALIQGYTFLYTERGGILGCSANAGVWQQPGVSRKCKLIGSQDPNFPVDPDLVEFETTLRTPLYDFGSFSTVGQLPSLNGVQNTYYCGSYCGLGLHEDAVRSAVEVARKLNVDFWGT